MMTESRPPWMLSILCVFALVCLCWGCDDLLLTPTPSSPGGIPTPVATGTSEPTDAPTPTHIALPVSCDEGTPWPLEALIPPQ